MGRNGCYLFLGCGDATPPNPLTDDWTVRWERDDWLDRLDRLADLGVDTLFVYLMGYCLPYASRRFPACVERDHPNVRNDFFQQIIDAARCRGIDVMAVLTTTGHAQGYARQQPRAGVRLNDGSLGREVLCHHKPVAIDYVTGVIEECLSRYHGFSGVVLHPPEFSSACRCSYCREGFRHAQGDDLLAADENQARGFFWETYFNRQQTLLEPLVQRLAPGAQALTFTMAGFEPFFDRLAPRIHRDTVIVEWDYNLTDAAIARLGPRLQRYAGGGHQVWFMPELDGAERSPAGCRSHQAAVRRQIRAATNAGVRDIVFFAGPQWGNHADRCFVHAVAGGWGDPAVVARCPSPLVG